MMKMAQDHGRHKPVLYDAIRVWWKVLNVNIKAAISTALVFVGFGLFFLAVYIMLIIPAGLAIIILLSGLFIATCIGLFASFKDHYSGKW